MPSLSRIWSSWRSVRLRAMGADGMGIGMGRHDRRIGGGGGEGGGGGGWGWEGSGVGGVGEEGGWGGGGDGGEGGIFGGGGGRGLGGGGVISGLELICARSRKPASFRCATSSMIPSALQASTSLLAEIGQSGPGITGGGVAEGNAVPETRSGDSRPARANADPPDRTLPAHESPDRSPRLPPYAELQPLRGGFEWLRAIAPHHGRS